MQKSLFSTISICFALCLITARPVRAQQLSPITGTAGFETGLQLLVTNIEPPIINDAHPTTGVTVNWGDGQSDYGLVQNIGASFLNNGVYSVYGTHLYAQRGTYTVQIAYDWEDCPTFLTCFTAHANLATTATISPPGNFVILSIGDSIASGEGNPNEPKNVGTNIPRWAFWDDAYSSYDVNPFPFPHDEFVEWTDQAFPCHRSSYAGPAQAAGQLTANNPGSGITFIHYACSGATIDQGNTDALWVQDAVGQLKVARARLAQFGAGIDILLISAGTNSLFGPTTFLNGFGGLVSYCLNNGGCSSNNTLQQEVNSSFNEIPTYYKNLAMEINCQQPPEFTGAHGFKYLDPDPGCTDPEKQIPKMVLITEYMDPTHDQNGDFPEHPKFTCGPAFIKMVQGDFEYFYKGVVVPINTEVDSFPAYAQEAGLTVPTYTVPNIALDFKTHGVCAGSQRWVNNGHDSETLLGEGPHPGAYPNEQGKNEKLNGTLHPNSGVLANTLPFADFIPSPSCFPFCGQEDYASQIVRTVQEFNPPVTTASATAGGNSYAFGTWTHESVAVSLSATNAISRAGVGPIYYAVDSTQCGSSFANPYPAVPGCTVYAGSFAISDSGKHTVTFFSANSLGFPIINAISMPPQIPPLPCPNPNTNPCNVQLPPLVPPLEGVLQSVQVWVNKEPPVMTCTATPSVLWPPNNKMVPVRLNVTAVSALFGQTPFSLKSVTTSEGDAATDIHGFVVGQPSTAGSLLASRLGNEKTGRVYTFVYQSTDESGLTGTCTAKVLVPHDQRKSNP